MSDTERPDPAIFIARDAPDIRDWSDPRHGDLSYRTLVDADHGPSTGLVQGIAYIPRGGAENPHRHDMPETVHVLAGRGKVRLGDREIGLSPGDTVFVPAGLMHGWSAPDEPLRLLYTFAANRFADVTYVFEEDA